jgi:hypothetical protein
MHFRDLYFDAIIQFVFGLWNWGIKDYRSVLFVLEYPIEPKAKHAN